MNFSSPLEWPEWNCQQQVVNCQNLHHNYERKPVNRERVTLIALFGAGARATNSSKVEHSVGIDGIAMRTFPLGSFLLPLSHSPSMCSAPLPHICIHEYSPGRMNGSGSRVCSKDRPGRIFVRNVTCHMQSSEVPVIPTLHAITGEHIGATQQQQTFT